MTTLRLIGVGAAALVTGVPLVMAAAVLCGPAAGLLAGAVLTKAVDLAAAAVVASDKPAAGF